MPNLSHEQIDRALGIAREGTADDPMWWVDGESAGSLDLAGLGLAERRRLFQMVRPLPLPDSLAVDATLTSRAHRPGDDDAEWLRVNNAAFAWHPDQAGWTHERFRRETDEQWFDPNDLRIVDGAAGVVGFCWTKPHPDAANASVGEIYVVAADPAHHGTGLGRRLVIDGLRWLWDRYRTPQAMLWVEASNTPALRLYERLGFEVVAERVGLGSAAPAPATTPAPAPAPATTPVPAPATTPATDERDPERNER